MTEVTYTCAACGGSYRYFWEYKCPRCGHVLRKQECFDD